MTERSKSGTAPLWKTHDAKANKAGPHHTVFAVRKNKEFEESVRLGVPAPRGAGPYLPGEKYVGDWVDNKREGYGTLSQPNGDKYEGEWLGGVKHGRGTQWVRRDGKLRKLYTGDWVMGKRHGVGVYFFKSGDKYTGGWEENKRVGRGRVEYANGDVYDGEWSDDKRAGAGVLISANGDQYEGMWANDMKDGPGRYFYMTTRKMYEGEWVADVPKCGVFSDIPREYVGLELARPRAAEDAFRLPELGLEDPDGVMFAAVDAARAGGVDAVDAGFEPAPGEEYEEEYD